MRRTMLGRAAILAGVAALVAVLPFQGLAIMIAPRPIAERVVLADRVLVGKVTAIEEKTVSAHQFPGAPNKVEYKIALIKIDDSLVGGKGVTHVRLGFIPPPPDPVPMPLQPGGIQVRPLIKRLPQFNPTVGTEALFFLTKHFEGDFLVVGMFNDVIDKKAGNFEQDVQLIKRCAKLLDDPNTSLKSKEADDRLVTAGMLVSRYKNVSVRPIQGGQPQQPKTEPIDAAQSKLILEAIASADWGKREQFTQLSPQMVFNRLGLTPQDGWQPGQFKNYQQEFPVAAQKWLKDNAATYRITRIVPEAAK